MSKVYRITSFWVHDEEFGAEIQWELLSVSVPRSFKFDVWASPVSAAYVMEYRGRFIPSDDEDDTVLIESEAFVRHTLEILKNNSTGVNITT